MDLQETPQNGAEIVMEEQSDGEETVSDEDEVGAEAPPMPPQQVLFHLLNIGNPQVAHNDDV
jgi:hypothetical protein